MYFQNVFLEEYRGVWVLADRQFQPNYKCQPNTGRGENYLHAFVAEPYNLSGNDGDGIDKSNLMINYAYDPDFKNYSTLSIAVDAGAASGSAVTAIEVANNLNANATFAEYFVAEAINAKDGKDHPPYTVRIKCISTKRIRFYISNNGAETALRFNYKAGVSDLPTYFNKDTIAKRFTYTDSVPMLVALNHLITGNTVANPTVITSVGHGLANSQSIVISNSNSAPTIDGTRVVTVINDDTFSVAVNVTTAGTRGMWSTVEEAAIITNAVNSRGVSLGYDATNPKEDWELLQGNSGLFTFKKQTIDGSNRITKIIEYPAGAGVGDLAKMIQYTYTGANTAPTNITEIPYSLMTADLITPP